MTNNISKDIFHVQLHLTNRCNLSCRHCYEGKKNTLEEWNYEELIRILKHIEEVFLKWEVDGEISLVGGEPTLYPHFNEVMKYIKQSDVIKRFAVLTNGVDLKEDVLNVIEAIKPTVQISLDGTNEIKHDFIRGAGTYKKAIATINRLVKSDVKVYVHYVISKYTVPIDWDFITLLDNMGVTQITFSRDVPIGNSNKSFLLDKKSTKDVFDTLFEFSRRLENRKLSINMSRPLWACYNQSGRCPVAFQTITILQDGSVYPCRRLPIKIGNIKNDSLFKIWYESEVLWDLRRRESLVDCGKCKYLDDCGGARCIAYAVTKNYMEADPQCWLI